MKWIKVEDKLPDENTECLVVDSDGDYGVGFYRQDAKAWDSCNFGWLETKHLVDNKEAFARPCGLGKIVAWTEFEKYKG